MRPTGDNHRRTVSPSPKPRDAEAMDAGVAEALDDKLGTDRANAGTKLKDGAPEAAARRRD